MNARRKPTYLIKLGQCPSPFSKSATLAKTLPQFWSCQDGPSGPKGVYDLRRLFICTLRDVRDQIPLKGFALFRLELNATFTTHFRIMQIYSNCKTLSNLSFPSLITMLLPRPRLLQKQSQTRNAKHRTSRLTTTEHSFSPTILTKRVSQ